MDNKLSEVFEVEITKNDFINYRRHKANLAMLKEQIAEIESLIHGISAMRLNLGVKTNNTKTDKIGQSLVKAEKLKEDFIEEMIECITLMKIITKTLKQIENPEQRRAVYLRFIVGLNIEKTAEKMCLSATTINRFTKSAFKELGV